MQNVHPLFVHFPIALLAIVPVLDAVALLRKDDGFHRAAWFVLLAGMLAGVLAVLTGLRAADFVPRPVGTTTLLDTHKAWAYMLLGLSAGILLLRPSPKKGRKWMIAVAVAEALLFWPIVFAAGHSGGTLVFEHGIGTRLVTPENLAPVPSALPDTSSHTPDEEAE